MFGKMGWTRPDLNTMRFVANNLPAYSHVSRGSLGGVIWDAQRDQTLLIGEFERVAFARTRQVFCSPSHLLATLDDELYRTRASDNQLKTLSARKADKEGHMADVIADSLFRVVLATRFRRRQESQERNVTKLIEVLLDGMRQKSLSGFVLTGDRGYGKLSLVQELRKLGVGTIFIMPSHLLRCHPFAASSLYDPFRDDEEETPDASGDELANEGNCHVQNEDNTPSEDAITENSNAQSARYYSFDRPKKFIIDDDSAAPPMASFSKKKLIQKQGMSGSPDVIAVAVRERGSEKYSNVLRFFYSVTPNMAKALDTFTAVPKDASLSGHLFAKRKDDGSIAAPPNDSTEPKEQLERHVLTHCNILTVSQRRAGRFCLRMFRITGTIVGKIVLKDSTVRTKLGLSVQESEALSPFNLLSSLAEAGLALRAQRKR